VTPSAIVERYLALIADHDSDPAAIRDLLEDGMRFVEHPNLFSPGGSDRDVPRIMASLRQGWRLLSGQRYEVLGHAVDGETVATRVRWTGTLATAAGPLPAGTGLEAHSSMWFTIRGGRIARQENYDCFTAPSPP
jgi:ketosteroid isomerase-like protein